MGSVSLKASVQPRHVVSVGGEDERAETLGDNGKVRVDDVRSARCRQPAPNRDRFVERMDLEVAHCSGQIGLACRVAPNLCEHWVGRVQLVASFDRPPDQCPQP